MESTSKFHFSHSCCYSVLPVESLLKKEYWKTGRWNMRSVLQCSMTLQCVDRIHRRPQYSDRTTVQRRHNSKIEKSIIRPVIKSSDDLAHSSSVKLPLWLPVVSQYVSRLGCHHNSKSDRWTDKLLCASAQLWLAVVKTVTTTMSGLFRHSQCKAKKKTTFFSWVKISIKEQHIQNFGWH